MRIKADDSVRAVSCFFIRRGARAIEGYPITTKNVIMEELLVLHRGYDASRPLASPAWS